mgnify:CR=1 FL=1
MNCIQFKFKGYGRIYWLNVGYLELKVADTEIVKMYVIYYKYCIVHISKTNKVRDLIFDTCTPWDPETEIFLSVHQAVPSPQVAPSTHGNVSLTISQRLVKLET